MENKEMQSFMKLVNGSAREVNSMLRLSTTKLANALHLDLSIAKDEIYAALKKESKIIIDSLESWRSVDKELCDEVKQYLRDAASRAKKEFILSEHQQLAAAAYLVDKPVYLFTGTTSLSTDSLGLNPKSINQIMDGETVHITGFLHRMTEDGLSRMLTNKTAHNGVLIESRVESDLGWVIETPDAIYTNIDFSKEMAQELKLDVSDLHKKEHETSESTIEIDKR